MYEAWLLGTLGGGYMTKMHHITTQHLIYCILRSVWPKTVLTRNPHKSFPMIMITFKFTRSQMVFQTKKITNFSIVLPGQHIHTKRHHRKTLILWLTLGSSSFTENADGMWTSSISMPTGSSSSLWISTFVSTLIISMSCCEIINWKWPCYILPM